MSQFNVNGSTLTTPAVPNSVSKAMLKITGRINPSVAENYEQELRNTNTYTASNKGFIYVYLNCPNKYGKCMK